MATSPRPPKPPVDGETSDVLAGHEGSAEESALRDAGEAVAKSTAPSAQQSDGAVALRNALRLGASLFLTWSVALIVAFRLPRYMGPELNGKYSYAESEATTWMVFLNLGIDTYIQREVPVRPKHMSDFFLGSVCVRLGCLLPIGAWIAWNVRGEGSDVRLATLAFGIAQVFMAMNETFAKALQAATQVSGLAVANVVSKVLWGGGALAAVHFKMPLVMLIAPLVASEAAKCAFLFVATQRAVALDFRFDLHETWKVLREAMPFFVSHIAVALGSALDVRTLGRLHALDDVRRKVEVGHYGAARKIAALSMLLSPVLSGVLIPMMRRAYERSQVEFEGILKRCVEGTTIVSLPFTLLLSLGADVWIRLALGKDFGPAAYSLRYLAPTFVFTYTNVLLWLALMIMGRSWTITLVSIGGVVLLPLLIFFCVPLTMGLGEGAAGMGTAIALSTREFVIACVFLAFLGRRAIDRRSLWAIGASLFACLVVALVHHALASLGRARLVVDGALYLALAFGLRVYRVNEVKNVLRLIKSRGRA